MGVILMGSLGMAFLPSRLTNGLVNILFHPSICLSSGSSGSENSKYVNNLKRISLISCREFVSHWSRTSEFMTHKGIPDMGIHVMKRTRRTMTAKPAPTH